MKNKYNFQDYQIGESREVQGNRNKISAAAAMMGKRLNFKFSTSKSEQPDHVKVTRVS